MRTKLSLLAGLVAALLLAAGCGGGGGGGGGGGNGSVPDGASVAPKGSALFVSLNTDFQSEQWQNAAALYGKFPGGPKLLAELQKQFNAVQLGDLKAALGPEADVVVLDFATGGSVGMSNPSDPAKLKALLAKDDPTTVTQEVEGWIVFADSNAQLAAFDAARKNGTLSDSGDFTDAMKQLPADAVTKLYVDGPKAQTELEKSLKGSGLSATTSGLGDLHSIAAAAVAEQDGVSLDGDVAASLEDKPKTYSPELPSVLPSGASLVVSFAHLDGPVRRAYQTLEKAQPSIEKQLNLFQGVTGVSVEGDLVPILAGEGAVAVYPAAAGAKLPGLALVLKLQDEQKVKNLLDQLASVLRLSGGVTVTATSIAGAPVQKIVVQGVTIYAGVFDGMLVVTNAEGIVSGLRAKGDKLADDPLYSQAADSAGLPDEVLGFVYADLQHGLPSVLDFAEQNGASIPAEARANTKPLQSLLLYTTGSSDSYSFGGFLAIQ
jgi:hypothetical protein